MTARIVHFGIDDSDLLRALRDAGYSVDDCDSLSDLQSLLKSNQPADAVAITEGNDAALSNVISLSRTSSAAPLILFQDRNSNTSKSEFNLVVPVLAPPDKWLKEITALVDRTRAMRENSQLAENESRSVQQEANATVERLRHETRRAGRQRKRNHDPAGVSCLTLEVPQGTLRGIRTGQFLMSMSDETLSDFQSMAAFSSCAPGTVLYVEGRPPEEVFVLLEGHVKLFMNSNDGKRLTVHIAGPGEVLGLATAFTSAPHRATAETLYPSKVASISSANFLKLLMAHPEASQSAARELGELCDRTYTRLRTIGVTPSNRSKLARLLLEWAARGHQTEHGIQIHLALTHGEIGECIGTCRESVTRILRDLQRWNVIEMRGSLMTITDHSALEQCAELK
jgi:CRP/FNR family transcriptional regulator, cyclic AMP receptor protein